MKKWELRVDVFVALAVLLIVGVFVSQGFGAELDTPERIGEVVALVQGSNVVYVGNMIAVDSSGLAVLASDTASLKVIGRCQATSDNTGAEYAATRTVEVKRGVFQWDNDGTFTAVHIGDLAYVSDESAVTTAALASHDIIAGLIVDLDDDGVWVDTFAIGSQGAASVTTLSASGAAVLGSTLSVAGIATFSDGIVVTDVTSAGVVTPAATNAPALISTVDAAWINVTIGSEVYVLPAYQLDD